MRVSITITGRFYHHCVGYPQVLHLEEGSGVEDALAYLHNVAPLPSSALVAVSGRHLGSLSRFYPCRLRDNDELLIFSPVAGG